MNEESMTDPHRPDLNQAPASEGQSSPPAPHQPPSGSPSPAAAQKPTAGQTPDAAHSTSAPAQARSASAWAGSPDPRPPEEIEAAQAAAHTESTASLQAELATLKAKSGELADQYLRAKADAENSRRRADEEIAKARKFAVEAFAESLLPVVDSLEAGLAVKDARIEHILEGSQAILRQLSAALERNKVVPIDPKPGERFDPRVHHAISIVSPTMDSRQVPGTVVNVLQKGYTIAERVLRPALVTVTAPK